MWVGLRLKVYGSGARLWRATKGPGDGVLSRSHAMCIYRCVSDHICPYQNISNRI